MKTGGQSSVLYDTASQPRSLVRTRWISVRGTYAERRIADLGSIARHTSQPIGRKAEAMSIRADEPGEAVADGEGGDQQ